ncbi:MAG: class I SAM-dependent methyltransferase [Saprospiraceae bacterium]|nr:class I SAM-dependent methyltransferase [Candidatus Brachybacter algidus]MBL0118570.1 class I SAM-dependent methyltransferase [Candidatus Brachybacter algidus]
MRPGNVTKYLLDKRPDFKMLATDLSPKMLEIAKEHNPSATFSLLDCKDIDQLKGSYDGIMCSFAFPYLSKEEVIKFFEKCYQSIEGGWGDIHKYDGR